MRKPSCPAISALMRLTSSELRCAGDMRSVGEGARGDGVARRVLRTALGRAVGGRVAGRDELWGGGRRGRRADPRRVARAGVGPVGEDDEARRPLRRLPRQCPSHWQRSSAAQAGEIVMFRTGTGALLVCAQVERTRPTHPRARIGRGCWRLSFATILPGGQR